ncbi:MULTISPECIES: hypothetical protein [Streptomyces]|uniref:DUF7544 domain-containing protein n=1 Tax=Streptomyces TaxID=1883 RepID=UPI000CD564AD|nr:MULTISPECIES: hypothetical protein [Streptomyces]
MSDRWTSPGGPPPEDGPDRTGPGEPTDLGKQPPQQPGWSGGGQPPQGGWSSPPPGSAPGPQQSWSGGPPQGWSVPPPGPHGWNQPPQAAKPGVIPLRPLGVGEILDGAVSTARAHWRPVLAIALGIAVISELISMLAIRTWFSDTSGFAALENNPDPTTAELQDALADLFSFSAVVGIVQLLGSVLATAMLTIVVSRAVLGRGVSVAEAWEDSRGRILRLLGLVLMVTVAAVAALLAPILLTVATGMDLLILLGFLIGIPLAVWTWVSLSLAAPALMLERQGVFAAMRRSWRLVTGSWWRVFGIQLLILVLVFVVSSVVQVPSSLLASLFSDSSTATMGLDTSWTGLAIAGVGSVLAAVVTLPLTAGVTALLYMDQRIRREALDLELARAAGLDDTGSGTGAPPTGPGY